MLLRRAGLIAFALGVVATGSVAAAQGYSLFAALGQPKSGSWLQDALKQLAPEVREAVERRLRRRGSYEIKTPVPETGPFEAKVAAGRRREIELGIVTLIEKPGAETDALEFARSAKLYYEWETDPTAPMDEAESATAYLKAHPTTIIEPYLRLYQLHRHRAAFESAVFMIDHPYPEVLGAETIARWKKRHEEIRGAAAAGYLDAWNALRDTTDIVVRAMADNLDEKQYVYLNVGAHPRRAKAPGPRWTGSGRRPYGGVVHD